MILEVQRKDLDVESYVFELITNDGNIIKSERLEVKDEWITLIKDSKSTDKHIKKIRLTPRAISV